MLPPLALGKLLPGSTPRTTTTERKVETMPLASAPATRRSTRATAASADDDVDVGRGGKKKSTRKQSERSSKSKSKGRSNNGHEGLDDESAKPWKQRAPVRITRSNSIGSASSTSGILAGINPSASFDSVGTASSASARAPHFINTTFKSKSSSAEADDRYLAKQIASDGDGDRDRDNRSTSLTSVNSTDYETIDPASSYESHISTVSTLTFQGDANGTKRGREDITATPQKNTSSNPEDKENAGGRKGNVISTSSNEGVTIHATDGNSENFEVVMDMAGGLDAPAATPPRESGPTPYWKVMKERGTVSPKLTRSAAKKKMKMEEEEEEEEAEGANELSSTNVNVMVGAAESQDGLTVGSDYTDGAEMQLSGLISDLRGNEKASVLMFSPPDQKKNRERARRELERRENLRKQRITDAIASGHLLEFDNKGNPKFDIDSIRSPPRKKRSTKATGEEEDNEESTKYWEKVLKNECKLDMTPVKQALSDISCKDSRDDSVDANPGGIDPPTNSKPTPAMKSPAIRSPTPGKGTPGKEWSKKVLAEIADVRHLIENSAVQKDEQLQLHILQRQQSQDEESRADNLAAMQDLIDKNEKHSSNCAVLEERASTLQIAVDEAKGLLSEARSLNQANEREFNEKLDAMKDECRRKAMEIDILKERLQKESESVEGMNNGLHGRIAELEQHLEERTRSLQELEWKLPSLEASLREMSQAKDETNALLEKAVREKEALLNDKVDLQEAYDDMVGKRVSSLEGKIDGLFEQTRRADAAEENLKQHKAQIEVLENEVQKLISDLESEREKVSVAASEEKRAVESKLKLELQQMEEENARLNADLASFQEKSAVEAELKLELEKMVEKNAQLNSNLVSFKEEQRGAESQLKLELQQMEEQNAQLNADLARVQKSLKKAKSQSEVDRENAKKKERELQGFVGSLGEKLKSVENDLTKSNTARTGLEKKLTTASHELREFEAMRREFEETKAKLAQTEAKLDGAEKNCNAMQLENSRLSTRLETFDEREEKILQKLRVYDETRRVLHNRCIQLAGNIRVFVRVRPVISGELETLTRDHKRKKVEQHDDESPFTFPGIAERDVSPSSTGSSSSANDLTKNVLELTEPYKDRGGLSARQKKWRYGFDNVYAPSHTQEDVWAGVEPLVQCAMDGFNVCVFAYGQTGSGKTHTMIGDPDNEGIIHRAVKKLFEGKSEMEMETNGKTKVEISVEMLEIYNEQVQDLLSPDKKEVEFYTSQDSASVVGNVLVTASSVDDVLQILSLAQQRRCVKATQSNAESSRSHLVFTIHYKAVGESFSRSGKLHVCDLAGSERLSKSGSVGTMLKETKHINTSLSCLSNVIEKLQTGTAYVPYRDSKLTSLLKDSLSGDSKTLAIVCCNPLPDHFNESLCSIRFAAKASRVELKAVSSVSF